MTIGTTFMAPSRRRNVSRAVIRHELRHVGQWRALGMSMGPLYLSAGLNPRKNFFEISAGSMDGGY